MQVLAESSDTTQGNEEAVTLKDVGSSLKNFCAQESLKHLSVQKLHLVPSLSTTQEVQKTSASVSCPWLSCEVYAWWFKDSCSSKMFLGRCPSGLPAAGDRTVLSSDLPCQLPGCSDGTLCHHVSS